jgi:ATP-binding cassette, subfamily A (ABC1), member 3
LFLQASQNLLENSNKFAASQYGAIYLSHDQFSEIEGSSSSYNETVVQTCLANTVNLSSSVDCNRFGGIGYVIQYNFTAVHVSPLYQSLADEALVRQAINKPEFNIKFSIAPLPITESERRYGEADDAFTSWFLIVLSFPFIGSAFAAFIVAERESKARHLQTVAGVEPTAYWISTFLWDSLNYQLPLWITVIMMFIFDVGVLTTRTNGVLSGVLAILFLYGPASAGFAYCASFAFKSPSMSFVALMISGFLIGFGGPIAIFIIRIIGEVPGNPNEKLLKIARILAWCLRIFPSFCLGQGLLNAMNIESLHFWEGDYNLSVWTEPILLFEVIFLILQTVVYLVLAILLDIWSTNPKMMSLWNVLVRVITCRFLCRSGDGLGDISVALTDDNDVIAEQDRVLSGGANDDLIVINQLTKVFDNGKLAVNNMSLGIPHGECFGLLGINGAGKTTTMGMLTAEFPPTSGDATLAGFSVTHEPQKTRRRIGYCPQFDAHFANLTGREHLELYASIKGIPKLFVKDAAASKLAEVGLSPEDSDRLSAGYSGGLKRRLSLACATIGQPQLVFLDECSTGVDPVARREIWQMISDMVAGVNVPMEEKTSVILTTHSMEECESLCPRIGIMANGRLRCLGSAQHLKTKFGQGFQVELKVALVETRDADYVAIAKTLLEAKGGASSFDVEDNVVPDAAVFFRLDEAESALRRVTGTEFFAGMVTAESPTGYTVWKDATSDAGVSLDALAAFATTELRMGRVSDFFKAHYPNHVLRERQDNKARFEVSSEGLRISSVFASIEENKEALKLSDYGVSQTSLEQVFNMHAAEAERLKHGRNDG